MSKPFDKLLDLLRDHEAWRRKPGGHYVSERNDRVSFHTTYVFGGGSRYWITIDTEDGCAIFLDESEFSWLEWYRITRHLSKIRCCIQEGAAARRREAVELRLSEL